MSGAGVPHPPLSDQSRLRGLRSCIQAMALVREEWDRIVELALAWDARAESPV